MEREGAEGGEARGKEKERRWRGRGKRFPCSDFTI